MKKNFSQYLVCGGIIIKDHGNFGISEEVLLQIFFSVLKPEIDWFSSRKDSDTIRSKGGFSSWDSEFQDQLSTNPDTVGENVKIPLIDLAVQTNNDNTTTLQFHQIQSKRKDIRSLYFIFNFEKSLG